MVKTGSGEEIKSSYQQLASALDEFIRKTFNEWAVTVDRDSYRLKLSPRKILQNKNDFCSEKSIYF